MTNQFFHILGSTKKSLSLALTLTLLLTNTLIPVSATESPQPNLLATKSIPNSQPPTPNPQPSSTSYLYQDHLGSLESTTDEESNLISKKNFSPFGKGRDVLGTPESSTRDSGEEKGQAQEIRSTDSATKSLSSSQSPTPNSQLARGYTDHEHLAGSGLIHMNGRVYDPNLGRFLSSDPIIQDKSNSQNLNRYSYVMNNPMGYTDPSGYEHKINEIWSIVEDEYGTNWYTQGDGILERNISPTMEDIEMQIAHEELRQLEERDAIEADPFFSPSLILSVFAPVTALKNLPKKTISKKNLVSQIIAMQSSLGRGNVTVKSEKYLTDLLSLEAEIGQKLVFAKHSFRGKKILHTWYLEPIDAKNNIYRLGGLAVNKGKNKLMRKINQVKFHRDFLNFLRGNSNINIVCKIKGGSSLAKTMHYKYGFSSGLGIEKFQEMYPLYLNAYLNSPNNAKTFQNYLSEGALFFIRTNRANP